MFEIDHCIYFNCLMNGANSQEESDRTTLLLCPICLRKLNLVLKCDLLERYKNLLSFFKKYGLEEQEKLIQNIIDEIKN
jgi:archaemetzincin